MRSSRYEGKAGYGISRLLMRVLFRSVKVIDKHSIYNQKQVDLLIENGKITQIGVGIELKGIRVIDQENLSVSPGWVDMRVALRDPGHELEEDIASLQRAAAQGGFTEILLLPNTQPVVDSKDTLSYIIRSGHNSAVRLLPTSSVTKMAKGVDFTEMIDMHHAGAVAFTDGENPISNPDILLKSLLYLRPYGGLLINRPDDRQLSTFGQMHEGVVSTLLGFKGIPSLSEEMMINRDLLLLAYSLEQNEYSQSNRPLLHFSLLSTLGSVALIRAAKAKGLPVSCDVAAHQLAFDDSALLSFETNLKVNPPFRSIEDQDALRKGLLDGTIDAIVSDHSPHAEEHKNLEFDLAEFGITGLETAFSVAKQHAGLPIEDLIEKFTTRPREILNLPAVKIEEGAEANLTFFDDEKEWIFDRTVSKSTNTPFLGSKLTGKVMGIINRGNLEWF